MVHPHDGDNKKTEKEAEKLRRDDAPASKRSVARNLQLQHHDGDDDGDHAITEGFETIGAHGSYIFIRFPAAERGVGLSIVLRLCGGALPRWDGAEPRHHTITWAGTSLNPRHLPRDSGRSGLPRLRRAAAVRLCRP